MNDPIKYSEDLNIRELIKTTTIPYIYCAYKDSPAYRLGCFTSGPTQTWVWDEKELVAMDDLTLWKIYALCQDYWCKLNESIAYKCKKKLSALGVSWYKD